MSDDHTEIIPAEAVEVLVRGDSPVHPIVAQAMAQPMTPETLSALLKVQREYEAGEARKAYTRALVGLKRDLPAVIGHDTVVDFQSSKGRVNYRHTSLAGVMTAIDEPMTSHGFTVSWDPSTPSRDEVRVTCRLTHADGHSEQCSLSAPPDSSGLKSKSQAVMSTVTLLRRYTVLSLLGIATADMDEPTGPPPTPPTNVDLNRNLRASTRLRKLGLKPSDAEALVGRQVRDWTTEDLMKISRWVEERGAEKPTAIHTGEARTETVDLPPGQQDLGIHADEPPEGWSDE